MFETAFPAGEGDACFFSMTSRIFSMSARLMLTAGMSSRSLNSGFANVDLKVETVVSRHGFAEVSTVLSSIVFSIQRRKVQVPAFGRISRTMSSWERPRLFSTA
jgi:hypothetical protein